MFGKFLRSRNWKGKKERRKEYNNGGWYDKTCKNHGGCPYCESNRLFNDTKKRTIAEEKIKEVERYGIVQEV